MAISYILCIMYCTDLASNARACLWLSIYLPAAAADVFDTSMYELNSAWVLTYRKLICARWVEPNYELVVITVHTQH